MKEKLLGAALAMGVGLGACASPETHDNVSVTGWDVVQEAAIMEYGWVSYSGKSSLPSGEIRNVDSYSVETGSVCAAYNTDSSCLVNVPIYDTHYDYEQKEPVEVQLCDQDPVYTEYASPDVSRNTACWEMVGPDQWLEKDVVDHIVRIVLQDKDEKSYTCDVSVDEDMYYRTAEERSGLRAKVLGKCGVQSLEYVKDEG